MYFHFTWSGCWIFPMKSEYARSEMLTDVLIVGFYIAVQGHKEWHYHITTPIPFTHTALITHNLKYNIG